MTIQPQSIIPYVFFGGRAEEAAEFYQNALGATILLMRHNQVPADAADPDLDPSFANKIVHGEVKFGNVQFFMSDGGCQADGQKSGFTLAVILPTESQIDDAYNALVEGGTPMMPPAPTFFCPRFAVVSDKFGLSWMLMLGDQS